jgi:hypothetical protein
MKNFLLLVSLLIVVACNNPGSNGRSDKDLSDVSDVKLKPSDTLDNLFLIADEKQLKEVYGEKNVSWDTVWGAEGEFYMGTKLYGDTPDEIVIEWADTTQHAKVLAVSHACRYNVDAEKFDLKTRWKTKAGVKMGTTLTELVDLNGTDFMFYGLGWDYGGGVFNWKEGKLANSNIFVNLGIDEMNAEQEKSYLKVIGDKEFSSANPSARKLNPLVFEIILAKK